MIENSLNQFEQNLESFVQFVEQYQEYQNEQQSLLQKLQDENVVSIQALAGNQDPLYSDSIHFLNHGGQQMTNNLQLLESQLQQNNEMLGELSTIRKTQVEKQKKELIIFLKEQENSTLNQIQTTILSQKNELSKRTPPIIPMMVQVQTRHRQKLPQVLCQKQIQIQQRFHLHQVWKKKWQNCRLSQTK